MAEGHSLDTGIDTGTETSADGANGVGHSLPQRSEVSGRRDMQPIYCDPCMSMDERNTALYFCVDCNERLCSVCGRAHMKSKASKRHAILPVDDMSVRTHRSDTNECCSEHPERSIEYYCPIHDHFCCEICRHSVHRHCHVSLISELASWYDASSEYQGLVNGVQDLSKQLEDMKNATKSECNEGKACLDRFIKDIKDFRSSIDELLGGLEEQLVSQARGVSTTNKRVLESLYSTFDRLQSDVNRMSASLTNKKSNQESKQLLMTAKRTQVQMKLIQSRIRNLSKGIRRKDYSFERNKKFMQAMQTCESLGRLQLRQQRKDEEGVEVLYRRRNHQKIGNNHQTGSQQQAGNDQQLGNHQQVIGHQRKASIERTIKIKHPNDPTNCQITGMALLDDNRLAVVDRNNTSVKIVDLHTDNPIKYIKLKDQPFDVTYRGNGQLVVTCEIGLTLINVDTSIPSDNHRQICLDGECRGITYLPDDRYAVVFISPSPAVKIIDNNEVIHQTFTNHRGSAIFTQPLYICLDTDKDLLYVSDIEQNKITAIDFNGNVKAVSGEMNSTEPHGLVADEGGNIFYAGRWSHNIHQLTSDCKQVQALMQHKNVEHPKCLAFCIVYDKLYVANGGSMCDFVCVIKLT